MSDEHFVIIGNGPAGHEAALTLREEVPLAEITLISKGRGASYLRRLLPDFIAGRIKEENLYRTSASGYGSQGIKFRCDQRVVDLNIEKKELILDHKEILPFTGLIIAVGGKPRIPEPLFVFQDLMHTLKTLEDARVWKDMLSRVEKILIVGGDLTSFAMTQTLLSLNKSVLFIIDEEALWPLRSEAKLLEEVNGVLAGKGVEVLQCSKIRSMTRQKYTLLHPLNKLLVRHPWVHLHQQQWKRCRYHDRDHRMVRDLYQRSQPRQ